MKYFRITIVSLFTLFAVISQSAAQEYVAPVDYNPCIRPASGAVRKTAKTTALSLPFFEDFTGYDEVPDTSRWENRQVYINNTMCDNPVSRGVATFDALSQYGVPYDTVNPNALHYADSLTSKVFDLSAYTPGDSVYLSFFYQAGGKGFSPERQDSLMLYFVKKGTPLTWVKVWSVSDSGNSPFRQAMVPVTDPDFFHSEFRFRFVNKATIGINDDIWNLDYIRMDKTRSYTDTAVPDIAWTVDPGFLLNDYTFMPYRQFLANASAERAADFRAVMRNNYTVTQNVNLYGYTARETVSGSSLATDSKTTLSLGAGSSADAVFPVYTATTPLPGIYDRVVFENKFYLQTGLAEHKDNDTIKRDQVFDNYLAYDDGTAEMSYFLNLFPTLPGRIAIEHHLNQPDTIRGAAIYFGRQVPLATSKYFSLIVYKSIAYGGGTDNIVYQEDNLQPAYRDTVNHYFIYKFSKPVPMPAGTFFISTMQPALSGSDSLYFGLDRNRKGGNHVYYNVLNYWVSSLIEGAVMIRPLLGQPVSGSVIREVGLSRSSVTVSPNPATDQLQLSLDNTDPGAAWQIIDLTGRELQSGVVRDHPQQLNITSLTPGVYLLKILSGNYLYNTRKFIKQ